MESVCMLRLGLRSLMKSILYTRQSNSLALFVISEIGKHFSTAHWDTGLLKESQFRILKKCQGKFDCLVYEMLFIKERNPSLNMQTDSIRAKLFV